MEWNSPPGRRLQLRAAPIPMARLEKFSTSRCSTKAFRFLPSLPAHRCLSRYGFHLNSNFLDYPKLGVWPDGYYMAANVFNTAGTAFLGPQAFCIRSSENVSTRSYCDVAD